MEDKASFLPKVLNNEHTSLSEVAEATRRTLTEVIAGGELVAARGADVDAGPERGDRCRSVGDGVFAVAVGAVEVGEGSQRWTQVRKSSKDNSSA